MQDTAPTTTVSNNQTFCNGLEVHSATGQSGQNYARHCRLIQNCHFLMISWPKCSDYARWTYCPIIQLEKSPTWILEIEPCNFFDKTQVFAAGVALLSGLNGHTLWFKSFLLAVSPASLCGIFVSDLFGSQIMVCLERLQTIHLTARETTSEDAAHRWQRNIEQKRF